MHGSKQNSNFLNLLKIRLGNTPIEKYSRFAHEAYIPTFKYNYTHLCIQCKICKL